MNGGHNANLSIQVKNNIIYASGGIPYLIGPKTSIHGYNNLFYGGGSSSGFPDVHNTVKQDPLFVNLSQHEFHLGPGSPARHAGADVGAGTDRDGLPRDAKTGFGIGAYQ
jgi:hypothetical protein